jgi:hypothetical protein
MKKDRDRNDQDHRNRAQNRIEHQPRWNGRRFDGLPFPRLPAAGFLVSLLRFGMIFGIDLHSGRNASAGSGAGGAKTGSLSGGISARSEKLLLDEPAAGLRHHRIDGHAGECLLGFLLHRRRRQNRPAAAWDSGALTSKSLIESRARFQIESSSNQSSNQRSNPNPKQNPNQISPG